MAEGRAADTAKPAAEDIREASAEAVLAAKSAMKAARCRLFRRLPKRGFSNYQFARRYEIVNVSQLDRFENGSVIDVKSLFSAGLVNSASSKVKVLGDGELTKKLNVSVHKFSKTAHDKILSCGGVARIVA